MQQPRSQILILKCSCRLICRTSFLPSSLHFPYLIVLFHRSLPCASPSDASALRSLVSTYFSHPNQLQLNNKAFVSTFAGESCTFGSGSPAQGWESQFTANGEVEGKMHFVPAFFVDPKEFSQGGSFENVIDGDFNVCLYSLADEMK